MSSHPRPPLPEADVPADPHQFIYSVVVPVFNSVDVVGETIDRITEVFEQAGLRYQLILVNDGSKDGSWDLIAARARSQPHIVALNLLRNYGQHHANLAGHAGGHRRLRHHHGRRPPEPARPGTPPDRGGDEGPRRRLRQVRAQAGARLPTHRQQDDRPDQPPGLRAAARPHGLQLQDPAPRRGRPDLRVTHGTPLHHRPGADVLQQRLRRPGPARRAPGRQEQLRHCGAS